MGRTIKKLSKGLKLEIKKGEQTFLRVPQCLYLVHIPIKLYEYIMNSELVIVYMNENHTK